MKKSPEINEHIKTLNRFAQECDHITEFGTRVMISLWAFLYARPRKFITYDFFNSSPYV